MGWMPPAVSEMIISFILEIVAKQITEGENTLAPYEALIDGLRITEVMYAPAAGGVEFIELKNVGSQTLNLKMSGSWTGLRSIWKPVIESGPVCRYGRRRCFPGPVWRRHSCGGAVYRGLEGPRQKIVLRCRILHSGHPAV